MNCWEILEIEKTDDIKAIKKAYAVVAKKYHPEEDQAAFLRVNKAYKLAISIASGKMIDVGLIFHSTNYAYENEKKERLWTDEASQHKEGDLDYEDLIEKGIQENYENVEAVLAAVDALYYNAKRRNHIDEWEDFFMKDSFRILIYDREFTRKFLKFFMTRRDMRNYVWNRGIVPVLKEWQYSWQSDSELESQFAILLKPIHQSQITSRRAKVIIALVVLLYIFIMTTKFGDIIASFSFFGENNTGNNTNNYTYTYTLPPTSSPIMSKSRYTEREVKAYLALYLLEESTFVIADIRLNGYIEAEEYYELLALSAEGEKAELNKRIDEILAKINWN